MVMYWKLPATVGTVSTEATRQQTSSVMTGDNLQKFILQATIIWSGRRPVKKANGSMCIKPYTISLEM